MEPDRRRLMQMMAAALVADTTPAAGPVKWSTGTELPKLKAPAHACDCHHYLYDSRYPVDRRGIMFPGNASIADYRALQRRLGITRQVVVQPSAYGVDNRPVLAAVAALGRAARGVVVVADNISDAELRRMHERGVRAIQFNFAPPGPTTPAMIEPLSRRVSDLGWHVEVNVWAAQLPEILPILARLLSPIVLEHLGHIPEPEGVRDPLFGMVRRLIDRGRTWVKLAALMMRPRSGRRPMPTRAPSRAPMSKSRPSGSSGGPTGRIRAKIPNPTMRCFSTCCLVGRLTRKCATASLWRTRRCSTAFRRRAIT